MLRLNADEAKVIEQVITQDNAATQQWESAQQLYSQYRELLIQQPEQGIQQDWRGLAQQLSVIVDRHPEIKTRIRAKRYLAGVQKVIERKRELVGSGLVDAVLPTAPVSQPAQRSQRSLHLLYRRVTKQS